MKFLENVSQGVVTSVVVVLITVSGTMYYNSRSNSEYVNTLKNTPSKAVSKETYSIDLFNTNKSINANSADISKLRGKVYTLEKSRAEDRVRMELQSKAITALTDDVSIIRRDTMDLKAKMLTREELKSEIDRLILVMKAYKDKD